MIIFRCFREYLEYFFPKEAAKTFPTDEPELKYEEVLKEITEKVDKQFEDRRKFYEDLEKKKNS